MMLTDSHIHTNFSDGINAPEEMLEKAIELGFKKVVFTDHVRADSEWIYDYFEEIQRMRKEYSSLIEIGIGVETKIVDFIGTLDCPRDVLMDDRIEKVASIHRIPMGNGTYIRKSEIGFNKNLAFECYLRAVNGLKNNCKVNRLAHPFSLFPEMDFNKLDDRWGQVSEVLNGLDIFIEYNVKYDNQIVPDSIWDRFNNRVLTASDSHSIFDLENRSEQIYLFLLRTQ